MKILKIFGVVVGIHVFALILIFANPGCSSTTKPTPQPTDTVARSEPAPTITVPSMTGSDPAAADPAPAITPATGGFNPDAPATYGTSANAGVRFTPTRPNTPAASAVLSQPVDNVTPATTYVVKAGDSLWTLQKRFHINLKEIAAANNIKVSSPLHEGQKLIIPSRSPSSAPATSAKTAGASAKTSAVSSLSSMPAPARAEARGSARPTTDEFKYTVKPGETLGMIARKFDVKVRDLAVHNNISDPRVLRAGTELSIPGWQAASGGKTLKASSSAPAPSAPSSTTEPSTPPNLLEPSPSEPTPTPTTSVPVINIDENPITPAPAPKS